MRDASRLGRGVWNLNEWGLRWKVIAVLAVPLVVAMVLGSLRVVSSYNDSSRLSDAAADVGRVPAAIQLEASTGTVIGGQVTDTGTQEDVDLLKQRIAAARDAAEQPDTIPEVAAAFRRIADTAQKTADRGTGQVTDVAAAGAEQRSIQADVVAAVESTVRPIEDNEVVDAKTQLVDSLSAQGRLFDEVIAGVVILQNPRDPGVEILKAEASERALVDSLARSYPKDSPRIADLYKGLDTRLQLISQGQATGQFPLLELRESLLASLSTYTDLISLSTKSIIGTVNDRAESAKTAVYRDAAIMLATLLIAIALAYLVARSLLAPLRRLRRGALQVAEYDLPDAVERIKAGESIDDFEFAQVPVHTSEEIGQVARAVDDIHGQAIRLAGEQASLRLQINDMFETLARRTKTLVDHQLRLIEDMEFSEKDPKLLESLFRLDHIAARMRRNGDNLLILAGTRVRRGKAAPVNLVDVLRAAVSEVEDYRRVKIGATPEVALAGTAARDVAHLIAELLDNALRASPPSSDVTFSYAKSGDDGIVLEVADRGIGIPPDELTAINDRLELGAEVGADTARRMGLFVVSRLADRHGMRVRLRPSFDSAREPGVTVGVHIPASLIVSRGGDQNADRFGPAPSNGSIGQGVPTQTLPAAAPAGPALTGPGPNGLPQRRPGAGEQRGAEPQRPETQRPEPQRTEPQRPAASSAPIAPAQPAPQSPAPTPPAAPAARPTQAEPAPASALGASSTSGATGSSLSMGPPPSPAAARTTANGLPRRRPGTALPPQQRPLGASASAAPAPSAPATPPESAPAESAQSGATAAGAPQNGENTRHRYRSNPVKTASFFQSRVDRPDPPIFAELSSNWLDEPARSPRLASGVWESAGDDGWDAARRASQAPVENRTGAGLPKRDPGNRLVPGGVGNDERQKPARPSRGGRDPEAIRANLSRHQQGVRSGRAIRTAETTDEGQR